AILLKVLNSISRHKMMCGQLKNSGVYLLAQTMQVASAKDKNPILSNMGFYGVIQEIWDLDYQKFTIPVFRCDWIDSSGLVVDELGFTL
ncbi:PREDICTED: transposase, partial [Prunus dulcis]